jgi:hypothetical protein
MSTTSTATVTLAGNASVLGVNTPGAIVTITETPQNADGSAGTPVSLPTLTTDISGNYTTSVSLPLPAAGGPASIYIFESTSPAVAGSYSAGDSGPQTVDITAASLPALTLTLVVTVTSSGAVSVSATAKN